MTIAFPNLYYEGMLEIKNTHAYDKCMSISVRQEKIHIRFFEACFLILYFHACICKYMYVAYINNLVFKPSV